MGEEKSKSITTASTQSELAWLGQIVSKEINKRIKESSKVVASLLSKLSPLFKSQQMVQG